MVQQKSPGNDSPCSNQFGGWTERMTGDGVLKECLTQDYTTVTSESSCWPAVLCIVVRMINRSL
jgi:hypothetical protein